MTGLPFYDCLTIRDLSYRYIIKTARFHFIGDKVQLNELVIRGNTRAQTLTTQFIYLRPKAKDTCAYTNTNCFSLTCHYSNLVHDLRHYQRSKHGEKFDVIYFTRAYLVITMNFTLSDLSLPSFSLTIILSNDWFEQSKSSTKNMK